MNQSDGFSSKEDGKISNSSKKYHNNNDKCTIPCSISQLLAIIIPILILVLFCLVFIPVYISYNYQNNQTNTSNISNYNMTTEISDEYDEFDLSIKNLSYATLTPKNGYDNIYIHLGGITEVAGYFSSFFKSNSTFIPKGTKIYYLSGKLRFTKYAEKYNIIFPVPSWFNVDNEGNLICNDCSDEFEEAKESLNDILDSIDTIAKVEKISYDKIYLGGFSQGGIMTNYVLLNSRHKLGGYLPFSGYVFDHHFPPNYVITELSDTQKEVLQSKKNYHILATHSFNDNTVFYPQIIEAYYTYYKDYTDFKLLSFGKIGHDFDIQPIFSEVRAWLKESMGK